MLWTDLAVRPRRTRFEQCHARSRPAPVVTGYGERGVETTPKPGHLAPEVPGRNFHLVDELTDVVEFSDVGDRRIPTGACKTAVRTFAACAQKCNNG